MCNSDTQLFIADDLNTGLIHVFHTYVESSSLNQFQFAAFLSQQVGARISRRTARASGRRSSAATRVSSQAAPASRAPDLAHGVVRAGLSRVSRPL